MGFTAAAVRLHDVSTIGALGSEIAAQRQWDAEQSRWDAEQAEAAEQAKARKFIVAVTPADARKKFCTENPQYRGLIITVEGGWQ